MDWTDCRPVDVYGPIVAHFTQVCYYFPRLTTEPRATASRRRGAVELTGADMGRAEPGRARKALYGPGPERARRTMGCRIEIT